MTHITVSPPHTSYDNSSVAITVGPHLDAFNIDPLMLAHLDFGLFKSLSKLGTSRTRICSVLALSAADFDYVEQLRLLTEGSI